MNKEAQNILTEKNLDIVTFASVYTVEWYNMLRRHKLVNKKLTEYEFEMLKNQLKFKLIVGE